MCGKCVTLADLFVEKSRNLPRPCGFGSTPSHKRRFPPPRMQILSAAEIFAPSERTVVASRTENRSFTR